MKLSEWNRLLIESGVASAGTGQEAKHLRVKSTQALRNGSAALFRLRGARAVAHRCSSGRARPFTGPASAARGPGAGGGLPDTPAPLRRGPLHNTFTRVP